MYHTSVINGSIQHANTILIKLHWEGISLVPGECIAGKACLHVCGSASIQPGGVATARVVFWCSPDTLLIVICSDLQKKWLLSASKAASARSGWSWSLMRTLLKSTKRCQFLWWRKWSYEDGELWLPRDGQTARRRHPAPEAQRCLVLPVVQKGILPQVARVATRDRTAFSSAIRACSVLTSSSPAPCWLSCYWARFDLFYEVLVL